MNRQFKPDDINPIAIDLHGAFIRRTKLTGASLRNANLENVDGRGADFSFADFTGANLRGANLSGADLRGADFRDTILTGADLRGANLVEAKNLTQEQLSEALIE